MKTNEEIGKPVMGRLVYVLATALHLGMLVGVGCNTTEGFGEDLESVGENISDEAEDAND